MNEAKHNKSTRYVYYIEGAGGSGKTRLSRELGVLLSDGNPLHIAPIPLPGINSHFTNDYDNEPVSILDTITLYPFIHQSFKTIFDNHMPSPISYKNKIVKWSPSYVLLINSEKLETYFTQLIEKEDSKLVDTNGCVVQTLEAQDLLSQLNRRVTCVFYLETSGYCQMRVRTSYQSNFKTKAGSYAELYGFNNVKEFNFGTLREEKNVKALARALYNELGKQMLR